MGEVEGGGELEHATLTLRDAAQAGWWGWEPWSQSVSSCTRLGKRHQRPEPLLQLSV